MRLNEVMRPASHSVTPETTLAEAVRMLESADGEPLPVYRGEEVVGLVTERAVLRHVAHGRADLAATPVSDVMDRDVPICYGDDDVNKAIAQIQARRARGLVVMSQDRRVLGTASLEDLQGAATPAMAASAEPGLVTEGTVAPPARVFLQPIAAPSILGLYGFAGATFIVASNMAGWYGGDNSAIFLFPFAAMFGGLAQFAAGMWSYRARDAVATAMHGMWGAFWLGYGVLWLLIAVGSIAAPTGPWPALGFWFIVLGAITWVGCAAAMVESAALFSVLFTLAAGSSFAAGGFIAGAHWALVTAGWWFVVSAFVAFYTASALMLKASYDREVLPVGAALSPKRRPGPKAMRKIQYALGEPGVKAGQ